MRSDTINEPGRLSNRWSPGTARQGEEQAALGECLLVAMDAAAGDPSAEHRLVSILDDARLNHDAHVEMFGLDALARIAAESGDVATAVELCEA